MLNTIDWCNAYQDLRPIGIHCACSVSGKCKKVFGGRSLYAEIDLDFDKSEELKFLSNLSNLEYHHAYDKGWIKGIFLGVLDVMLVRPIIPITIFSCTIKKIRFHEIDSSVQAFRIAGRYAAEKFLEQEKFVVI